MSAPAAETTDGAPRDDQDLIDTVNAWLEENWDPDLGVAEWWAKVGEAGWTTPHFPADRFGRGLSPRSQRVVRALFKAHGALRPPGGLGLMMAAPTILTLGTPDQQDRLIPPILNGSAGWCQLFSEPGAGSDLAGLTTRAERDGDRWIITGQKVWSSYAAQSDFGMLLARTDFGVPKHGGISWFAFKLDQPGVEVRPLREMTGDAVFNEVFIDEAEVDHADLIGGEGNGWMATQTTLHFERTGIGAGGSAAGFPMPGPKGGMWGRTAGDAAQDEPPNDKLTLGYDDVVELARQTGRTEDPHVRQDLARLYAFSQLGLWNSLRGRDEAKAGGDGGQVASIGKLAQTRIVKSAAALSVGLLGPGGTLAGPDGHEEGTFAKAMVFSAASSIYGGADEIQRNIVAERTLGLPREPNPDKDRPYGEILRRTGTGAGTDPARPSS